jgi:alpha-2-macroglobulin
LISHESVDFVPVKIRRYFQRPPEDSVWLFCILTAANQTIPQMRLKSSLLFLFVIPVFFLSCNRNLVNLDFTNAKEEVGTLTNLVFRFDKTLIADSLINRWDSTVYISFEPAIAGKFRWEHGDELVFSPSQPLLPATNYRATLNSDILQFSKYNRFSNADRIQFHTPALKLENTNSSWVLQNENNKTFVPQLDMFFNYPVEASLLKDKLSITLDDKVRIVFRHLPIGN